MDKMDNIDQLRQHHHQQQQPFNMTHLAIQANETLKELLEFEDSLDSFVGNMTGTAESLYTALEFSKIFHYISAIFGVIGNLLIIIIYLKNQRIRNVTNTYILNVAISDLLYVITVPIFLISIWSNSWPFGEFVCKLLLSKGAIHRFASSLFLLVLIIDTYLSILKPTLSHLCYKKPINSRMICIITWIICIISVSPVFYHASTISVPNSEINHCDLFWTGNSREAYIWFTIISAFIIPTIIKILLSIPLIYTLAGENNNNDTLASEGQYQVFAERNKRSAHLILTIIIFHILCWLPLWISLISVNLLPMNEMPDNSAILFHMISGCLGMANTVLNPFIYFKLSNEFYNGFVELKETILYHSKFSLFSNNSNHYNNNGNRIMENNSSTTNSFNNINHNNINSSNNNTNKTTNESFNNNNFFPTNVFQQQQQQQHYDEERNQQQNK